MDGPTIIITSSLELFFWSTGKNNGFDRRFQLLDLSLLFEILIYWFVYPNYNQTSKQISANNFDMNISFDKTLGGPFLV